MNTFSASGLLLQYRRLNRKRTKPSPMTLAYTFVLSSGVAMLYLTVSLSHYVERQCTRRTLMARSTN
jgi:hypothetical protein